LGVDLIRPSLERPDKTAQARLCRLAGQVRNPDIHCLVRSLLFPRRGFVRGDKLPAHSHYGTSFVGRALLGRPPRIKPRECVSEQKSRREKSREKNNSLFLLAMASWLLCQCRLAALFPPSAVAEKRTEPYCRTPSSATTTSLSPLKFERASRGAGRFLETVPGVRATPGVCPEMCSAPAVRRKRSAKNGFFAVIGPLAADSCTGGVLRIRRHHAPENYGYAFGRRAPFEL